MKEITIDNTQIGSNQSPYIIAEIGVNHEGSLDLAKKQMAMAKEAGANCVKFQTYKAGKIAAKNSPAYWDTTKESTKSQFELFQKYDQFGPDEYKKLAMYAKEIGVTFMSTPFDLEAVDDLNSLVNAFKIASADITNKPLLIKVAKTLKPIILSTGAAYLSEIEDAVQVLESNGTKEIILLHCVLNYPCKYEDAHLNMMDSLKKSFPQYLVGYSDHTPPDANMDVMTAAWLKGACVIEKHFTHDKSLPGNDHYHAMDESDLKKFREKQRFLSKCLGDIAKKPVKGEENARKYARRSLVTMGSIKKGEKISYENTICKRPALGISPMFLDELKDKKFRSDLPDDHIITWQDLE